MPGAVHTWVTCSQVGFTGGSTLCAVVLSSMQYAAPRCGQVATQPGVLCSKGCWFFAD